MKIEDCEKTFLVIFDLQSSIQRALKHFKAHFKFWVVDGLSLCRLAAMKLPGAAARRWEAAEKRWEAAERRREPPRTLKAFPMQPQAARGRP